MKAYHKIALASALSLTTLGVGAQQPWLHIYYPNGGKYQGVSMDEVTNLTFDPARGLMIAEGTDVSAPMNGIERFVIGPNVARLDITTDDNYLTEIQSKEEYVTGTLRVDGRGIYPDLDLPIQVRGRGNSTWAQYPKKPYRIKFAEKTKVCGFRKAKNYVLLANYIDYSLMRNFVAFKFGEIIGSEVINHTLPVDVYFNNIYKGSYMLTEKVGINNGSINLPKEVEANSILFELDSYDIPATDDAFHFDDETFGNQVIIKDPDGPTDAQSLKLWQQEWQDDFNAFMDIAANGTDSQIFEAADLESLVRYIMIFDLTCNQEIDHPKSVYVNKIRGEKYKFGPAWDFDWAFGYRPSYYAVSEADAIERKRLHDEAINYFLTQNPQPIFQNWYEYNNEMVIWDGNEVYIYSYSGNNFALVPYPGEISVSTAPSYQSPLLGIGKSDRNGGLLFLKLCNNDMFKAKFREVWDDFYVNKQADFWAAFDAYAATLEPSASQDMLFDIGTNRQFHNSVEELRQWVRNRIEFINTDPNMGLWDANTLLQAGYQTK